jgi:hypothetical protein
MNINQVSGPETVLEKKDKLRTNYSKGKEMHQKDLNHCDSQQNNPELVSPDHNLSIGYLYHAK